MFNSVAFDVVLGMIFVYLLYSLLISIVGEIIATRLKLRSGVLKIAIKRMLNDGGKTEFKYSFAGRFYQQPSIKFLAEGVKAKVLGNSSPAYITADTFANTVTGLLLSKGTGDSDMDKIGFCLKFNTLHIEPETLVHFNNLYSRANNDLTAFKTDLKQWFNETMDRTTGWYKKRTKVIQFALGFIIAVAFNLDSLQIAKLLSKDKDARGQLATLAVAYSKDTAKSGLIKRISGPDSLRNSIIMDSAANQVSRDVYNANKVLGLGWNFTSIEKHTCYSYRNNDTAIIHYLIGSFKGNMAAIYKQIRATRLQLNYLISDSTRSRLNTNLARYYATVKTEVNYLDKLDGASFIGIDSIASNIKDKDKSCYIYGTVDASPWGKLWYILKHVWPTHSAFWGWVITAIMLSLGAPFWFGLLQNIASLRGSGIRPEDKPVLPGDGSTGSGGQTGGPAGGGGGPVNIAQVALMMTPQPAVSDIDKAASALAADTTSTKGILRIVSGYIKQDGIKKPAIEVHAETQDALDKLKNTIGAIYKEFPINYLINTPATIHSVDCGSSIFNKTEINGPGTLGCFAKKIGSDSTYLVSAFHVLKGDQNWFVAGPDKTINNAEGIQVATLSDGAITPNFDAGFAELTVRGNYNNKSLNIKYAFRNITNKDAEFETRVQFIGALSLKVTTAVIDKHTTPVTLPYHGFGAFQFTDLFSICIYDENGNQKAPSQPGDSGSVVVDTNGYPLGLIVGGDALSTYVAKFSNIFSDTSIYKEYTLIIQ